VTHRGGPAVIGLQVVDDRPDGAPGWICCDGDPRPVLPGEARRFGVRGDHTDGPFQVRVESWNTDPVRIELTDKGRTTA
jgi:beta-mannosidase